MVYVDVYDYEVIEEDLKSMKYYWECLNVWLLIIVLWSFDINDK